MEEMSPKELLDRVEGLLKGFNPSVTTVDAYVSDMLGDINADRDYDKVFVQQVFYGCVRYRKFLKVFLTNFYSDNSSSAARGDYTRYLILSYLALFRVKELGFERFTIFVQAEDPVKTHTLLSYVNNMDKLRGQLRAEWIQILDPQFIDETIIGTLVSISDDMDKLLRSLQKLAFGVTVGGSSHSTPQKTKKVLTQPVAPNLTKPKPMKIPEPIRIPQEIKVEPPPNFNRLTLQDIEEADEKRRAKVKEETFKKYDSPEAEFKLHPTRSTLDIVKAEVESERLKELKFKFKAKAPPTFDAPAPIKMNAAAILREDALFKKKQEQETKILKSYEADLRDSTDYYRWQTEMRERDELSKLSEVERRRVEMAMTQQLALEASLRAKEENRELALQMKEMSKTMLEQLQLEKEAEEQQKRQIAQELKEERQVAPRVAEEKVLAERQKAVEDLKAKKVEDWERKLAEDKLEQERREDLIRQIRALERAPREQVNVFDPTTSSGIGLLEEMSLIELKERLDMNKRAQAKQEEDRRQDILSSKADKENDLRNRIVNIARIRAANTKAKLEARERRRSAEELAKAAHEEIRKSNVIKVASKIKEHRKQQEDEVEALQREEQRVANQRRFLGAAKSQVEELHFEQQLLGAEREVKKRQAYAKEEVQKYEEVKKVAKQQRKENMQKEALVKQKELARKLEEVKRLKTETKEKVFAQDQQKKAIAAKERTRKEAQRIKKIESNLYAHTISQAVLEQAKENSTRATSTLG